MRIDPVAVFQPIEQFVEALAHDWAAGSVDDHRPAIFVLVKPADLVAGFMLVVEVGIGGGLWGLWLIGTVKRARMGERLTAHVAHAPFALRPMPNKDRFWKTL